MQKTAAVMIAVIAVISVLTFLVRHILFPPMPPPPPATLLPAFIFLEVWDALASGIGVAFLLYLAINYSKWPKAMRTPLLAIFLIAVWFSFPNWIHDAIHAAGATPPNFALLAVVEYIFHFPWLILAAILFVVGKRLAKAYPNP